MKEINILFLAPHWRVPLIKAFRAARDALPVSGKLLGADSDRQAPSLQVVDVSRVLPPFSDPRAREAVLDFCARESVRTILPLTNKAVEFLDAHRVRFEQKNLVSYLPDPATIELCHDKLKLAEFFRANDIPMPETHGPAALNSKGVFPLITKKRRGEGGKDCFRVENLKEMEVFAEKFPDHIFQQFVSGREFTIDWFSDGEGRVRVIVPRERLVVRAGEVMVSRIDMDPRLIGAAKQAGSLLCLRGPCTLQGILDSSDQFWFTDINLRFGSGTVHTIAAGGNIPRMIYGELSGESPAPGEEQIQNGSIMNRFHEAFFTA